MLSRKQVEAAEALLKEVPDRPITDPGELNRTLLRAQSLGHLLSPVHAVDYVPEMHAVSFRYLFVDAEADTYHAKMFCEEDERALKQDAILKLWRNAGGRDVSSLRVDDRTDAMVAEYTVTVALQGIDGKEVETVKSRTVDLRPGSPESKAMRSEKQAAQARTVVCQNAETKARMRAIRSALGLKQKYKLGELDLPFIIPSLVAMPDTSDPAVRRLVAAKALGVVGELYGSMAARALGPATEDVDGDVIDTATGEVIDVEPAASTPDLDDIPGPEPDAPEFHNDCPCGDRTEMRQADYEQSMKRLGAARAGACFPSVGAFDVAKHEGIENLRLPNAPHLTIERLRAAQAKRRKAS